MSATDWYLPLLSCANEIIDGDECNKRHMHGHFHMWMVHDLRCARHLTIPIWVEKISPVHVSIGYQKWKHLNEEFSCSFPFCDLAVYIRSQYWQPLTALTAGFFVFLKFGKIGQLHPSTPASLIIFFRVEIFKKAQMRGCIRKKVCWQILNPRGNNFWQNWSMGPGPMLVKIKENSKNVATVQKSILLILCQFEGLVK